MSHTFLVGQQVRAIRSVRYLATSATPYTIVRALPIEGGSEASYRVKSTDETHERVMRESQLETL